MRLIVVTRLAAIFYFHSMDAKLVETSDGSHSLYVEALDEFYHSTHGAIQEANHVFLRSGLDLIRARQSQVRIFEVGFGTGLNAFMTWLDKKEGEQIEYVSIEAFPVEASNIAGLNYPHQLTGQETHPTFDAMHASPWDTLIAIDEAFQLEKIHGTLQDVTLDSNFDLIYFDAFAPRAQDEMWTPAIFEKMYAALKPGGVFVTYCAKGQVRRDLQSAGFTMERLPGPPGKREMLRGTK